MKFFTPLIFALSALPALAAEPLTGDEFEAYTKGKTLTFAENGMSYGTEQYYENRRVRWAFDQDTCIDGIWYENADDICFLYETGDPPQCWKFFLEGNKLRAVFSGESGTELYEAFQAEKPMACLGPQVGV